MILLSAAFTCSVLWLIYCCFPSDCPFGKFPLSAEDCSSHVTGTPIETNCYLLSICGPNFSVTFSETNKLRMDRRTGK